MSVSPMLRRVCLRHRVAKLGVWVEEKLVPCKTRFLPGESQSVSSAAVTTPLAILVELIQR